MILTTTNSITGLQQQELFQNKYANNPVKDNYSGQLIEGSFYQAKPMTVREMLTRRINKSLCFFLLATIGITFVSYYISMIYEAKLNTLDNEIVRINTENQDLQSELDKFRSFNNVDNKIGEFNLLQKADKVIEVNALNVKETNIAPQKISTNDNVNWAIGY